MVKTIKIITEIEIMDRVEKFLVLDSSSEWHLVDSLELHGFRALILECVRGQVNGYIRIPLDSLLVDLYNRVPIHEGWTFAMIAENHLWIGFDTNHVTDGPSTQNATFVYDQLYTATLALRELAK
jgi:hypothetical protein